jgi:hypothetical protein
MLVVMINQLSSTRNPPVLSPMIVHKCHSTALVHALNLVSHFSNIQRLIRFMDALSRRHDAHSFPDYWGSHAAKRPR